MAPRGDKSQIRGCLLGLAVGDALGAPFEGAAPTETSRWVEEGRADMSGGHGWEPGESTDDTAMALMLAESIADHGLLDTADVARRYIAWANDNPRGIGGTTRAALRGATSADDARAKAMASHARAGLTAGNGTVMRAAPIALAASSVEEATKAARDDAQLTHFDPAAACASAGLCAALIANSEGSDPVAAAVTQIDCHPRLEMVLEAVREGNEDAIRSVAASPEAATCWTTLGVALFALTKFDDYEPAVLWAISLGGDTDTNAAVTGALLGCREGPEAIPEWWLSPLRERERIEAVADRLADRQ
jgi:ADP-ribosyl-[dinitrogen reductase] hydrolase